MLCGSVLPDLLPMAFTLSAMMENKGFEGYRNALLLKKCLENRCSKAVILAVHAAGCGKQTRDSVRSQEWEL